MPMGLYGEAYEGTNTLVSQRLVGEVYLDDFEVSHTKNAIHFIGDEEEQIEDELEKQFSIFKKIAGTPYKELAKNAAVQSLQKKQTEERMGTTAVRNAILIEDVPTDKVVQDNKDSTLADLSEVTPDLVLNYGDSLKVQIYTDVTKTSNDAYVIFEYPNAEIINVVVNNKHPYYQQAIGDDPVVNHLVSVATDALAEWKCMQREGEIKPDTIRLLKDNILRAVTKADN
jgi:predicted membrane-bound dolichyl-phosphate-mannose-protein mannosyltransferase